MHNMHMWYGGMEIFHPLSKSLFGLRLDENLKKISNFTVGIYFESEYWVVQVLKNTLRKRKQIFTNTLTL